MTGVPKLFAALAPEVSHRQAGSRPWPQRAYAAFLMALLVFSAAGCDQKPTAPSPLTEAVTATQPPGSPAGAIPPGQLNVRDFGAKGDWRTDDTAAIQRALDAVPPQGGIVFFPPGGYLVPEGGLLCDQTVTLLGVKGLDGTGSRIHVEADNVVGLTLNGQSSVLDSMEITRASTTSSPQLTGVVLNSDFATVRSSRIAGFNTNLQIVGTFYTVENSSFRNFFAAGVEIDHPEARGDAGDGTITMSTFERAPNTPRGGAAVSWRAGGGLRFVNNKINGEKSLDDGLSFTAAADVVTGVVVISNNSIENFNGAGVNVMDGDGQLQNSMVVSGNQIASYSAEEQSFGILIDEDLSALSITGNTLYTLGSGISVQSVQHATISGNALANVINDGITVGDRARDVVIAPQAIDVKRGKPIVRP